MSQQKNSILINEHALNREPVPLSSYFHSASQSCPILSANCTFRHILHLLLFRGNRSAGVLNLHRQHVSYTVMLWKGNYHVAKEKSGKRQRRSREKGNQGVGDFRFINFTSCFSFFVLITFLLYHFFSILFLPTTFTHTHTHDPRPLPTTHNPRHLATPKVRSSTRGILQGYLKDSNAAAHSVDADISKAVIHLRALDLKNRKWLWMSYLHVGK